MQHGITRRRFLEGAAGLGAGAIVTIGDRMTPAAALPTQDTEVFPTGAPITAEYVPRGPNAPLEWFVAPEFVDAVGAQLPVYFGNIFSPDALELMAAIHGGTAFDYWRPVRWDFSSAVHGWLPTFLTDPYPADYPTGSGWYNGGGHIMLKATNRAGIPTGFNLGATPAYLAWTLEIGANCILEGEVLDDEYDSPDTLRGKPRMAELVGGFAGVGINFFRIDQGSYIGAATEVEMRNLVFRSCGVWPVGVYGAPWMSEKIDFTAENVHVVDLWSPVIEGGGFLGHNNAGLFRVRDCTVHTTAGGNAGFLAGALFAPNYWTTQAEVDIRDCVFDLPSLPFGSTGVTIGGGTELFQGQGHAKGNRIKADIGLEVLGNWRGDLIVAHNTTDAGKIGCLMGSAPEGASITVDQNRFQIDPAGSAAHFLPISAGLLGWDFSFTSMVLAGMETVPVPSHALVRANTFTGEADVGIAVGGPNASGIAAENVFVGNNLSGLETSMGVTYAFTEETANNLVAGATGGTGSVIAGNETNVFTGPGFNGLGSEAASLLADAMSGGEDEPLADMPSVWHSYRGPMSE